MFNLHFRLGKATRLARDEGEISDNVIEVVKNHMRGLLKPEQFERWLSCGRLKILKNTPKAAEEVGADECYRLSVPSYVFDDSERFSDHGLRILVALPGGKRMLYLIDFGDHNWSALNGEVPGGVYADGDNRARKDKR